MPFVTAFFNNTEVIWYPGEIDAYQAIKITNMTLTVTNVFAGGISDQFAIGFDEIARAAAVISKIHSQLMNYVELVENGSITYEINGIDKIIGDFVSFLSNNVNLYITTIVFYDVIKTSFDQYGQVSKTLKRYFTK